MPKNVARERFSSINGNGRRWATVQETAAYLRVTPRAVRLMMDDKRVTAYRLGSRVVRIDLNEVDAAMVAGI